MTQTGCHLSIIICLTSFVCFSVATFDLHGRVSGPVHNAPFSRHSWHPVSSIGVITYPWTIAQTLATTRGAAGHVSNKMSQTGMLRSCQETSTNTLTYLMSISMNRHHKLIRKI